jgi:hypothetical protein
MANADIIIPGEMVWRTKPLRLVPRKAEPKDPTPVQCIRRGISLYKARLMYPQELTAEDAAFLVANKVSKILIAASYQMATSDLYRKLIKWGIHKKNSKKISVNTESKEMENIHETSTHSN